MGLSKVVFSTNPNKTFEVEGHKFVTRKLLAKDMLDMDQEFDDDGKKASLKDVVSENMKILSKIIISVDGETPDSPEDTIEWLGGLENKHILEILSKSEVYGKQMEAELKNLEGTTPSAPSST